MKKFAVCALCFFSCLLFAQAVFARDFSSLDNDLSQLENLISDTLTNTEAQQRQLECLQMNLDESAKLITGYESIIQEQEKSLLELQTRLTEMSATYRTQSSLSATYEKSSKFWKIFTLIAIPVTALISGGIVWAAVR